MKIKLSRWHTLTTAAAGDGLSNDTLMTMNGCETAEFLDGQMSRRNVNFVGLLLKT
jgi:hypothetical protein